MFISVSSPCCCRVPGQVKVAHQIHEVGLLQANINSQVLLQGPQHLHHYLGLLKFQFLHVGLFVPLNICHPGPAKFVKPEGAQSIKVLKRAAKLVTIFLNFTRGKIILIKNTGCIF